MSLIGGSPRKYPLDPEIDDDRNEFVNDIIIFLLYLVTEMIPYVVTLETRFVQIFTTDFSLSDVILPKRISVISFEEM